MIHPNKFKLLIFSSLAVFGAFAQAPDGYYNALEGKSKAALKKAAKGIVKDHKIISYGENGTWEAFRKTDVRMVNNREIWWDMYSNNQVSTSNGHDGLNIEHSVANSWWDHDKNAAYKDLFHLNPSNIEANSRKSNYPLGEISTQTWTNGVTTIGKPKSGQGGGNGLVYEPADQYKGDFARVFFYMFTVYDDINWQDKTSWMYSKSSELTLKPWAYELLLRWAQQDPPDEKEINRNNAVYNIQGNRNPFIDLPDLCEYIWGDKNTTPYHVEGNHEPSQPVDPDTPDNPDPDDTSDETELLYADFEKSAITSYVAEGWGNIALSGNLDGWFLKEYQGNQYASASSYKETGSGPFEYWLITPELDAKGGDVTMTFRTQGAYGTSASDLKVFLLDSPDPSTAHMDQLNATICTPQPNGAKPVYSDWATSGDVKLGENMSKFYVGFRYTSTTGGSNGSATYCLDDLRIKAKPNTGTSVSGVADETFSVETGHCSIKVNIPAGTYADIFDLTGRCVARTGYETISLPRGVYIVVSPAGRAKVLVK